MQLVCNISHQFQQQQYNHKIIHLWPCEFSLNKTYNIYLLRYDKINLIDL